MVYLYVQIAVLIFACVFSLWILREHFEVDLTAKTKELEQQVSALDIENEKLEAEIATMTEKIPEYNRSLKTAEDQLGSSKDNYESKIMQKKAEVISNFDKQNSDCVEKMPPLVEEKTELSEKIMRIKPVIENLIAEINALKEKRNVLRLEEDRLKKEYLILFDEDAGLEKVYAALNMRLIKCNSR